MFPPTSATRFSKPPRKLEQKLQHWAWLLRQPEIATGLAASCPDIDPDFSALVVFHNFWADLAKKEPDGQAKPGKTWGWTDFYAALTGKFPGNSSDGRKTNVALLQGSSAADSLLVANFLSASMSELVKKFMADEREKIISSEALKKFFGSPVSPAPLLRASSRRKSSSSIPQAFPFAESLKMAFIQVLGSEKICLEGSTRPLCPEVEFRIIDIPAAVLCRCYVQIFLTNMLGHKTIYRALQAELLVQNNG